MGTQPGFFDAELDARRREIAEEESAMLRARRERFEQRKSVLLADTKSWMNGEFADRIQALLKPLHNAGEAGKGMHDAILTGINAAGNQGRLTEAHVAFVEQKSRIETARIGSLGCVIATTWAPRTCQDIAAVDVVSGQLPTAIIDAAVTRINALGPQLAALGFKDDMEVDPLSPKEAQSLKKQMSDVRQSLMTLAPARYRHAKNYKLASGSKLEQAESFASAVLGIDTRAHPGINTSVALTSSGTRSASVKPQVSTSRDEGSMPTIKKVDRGIHIGRVIEVNDHAVFQKTGRGDKNLASHLLLNLVGHSAHVGDTVHIVYKSGVGHVKNLDRELAQQGQSR